VTQTAGPPPEYIFVDSPHAGRGGGADQLPGTRMAGGAEEGVAREGEWGSAWDAASVIGEDKRRTRGGFKVRPLTVKYTGIIGDWLDRQTAGEIWRNRTKARCEVPV
jgi:hypothetical protein